MNQKIYALSTTKGYKLIQVQDILYCKASGNYTEVFTENGSSVITKQLHLVEQALPNDSFIRIHKSHLVNLSHANYYDKEDGGDLIMSDGTRLSVADSRKAELIKRLEIL